MRLHLLTIAVLLTAAGGIAPAAAAAELRMTPRGGLKDVTAFQRTEWRVDTGEKYDNPFDPAQIAIDATFTGPGGRTLVVPGFWMTEPGDDDSSFFAVRFAPPLAGEWSASVTAKDSSGTRKSDPISFDVSAGKSRGFVRRTPGVASRYFQFDSGEPFFMIGLNLAWADRRDVRSYEPWFRKLAEAGGNFARVWMAHPNEPTETVDAGIGRYDQTACAFYDTVLETAERHGVYCMLTFNNYRDLRIQDNWGECQWPVSPYSAANGGPATRPVNFITDARCRELYRQRLRYIAGRWGAYASVAFWEFWNEQTYTAVDIPPSWTRDMARYLKSVDGHGHLVTTSFGNAPQRAVWEMPEIDLVQEHLYPNADAAAPVSVSTWAHRKIEKPHLVAEFGISADGSDAKFDRNGLGTNLHNGLWAGMTSGSCGGGIVWWWDSYVDPRDLWKTFRGAANFSRAIDWPRRRFEPIYPPAPMLVDSAAAAAETFADSTLRAVGDWGKSHGQPVQLLPNGIAYYTVPRYLYGSKHFALRTPTEIVVDVPANSTSVVVVRVAKVSDAAILRISVDGEPKKDFPFSALLGSPGQVSSERITPDPETPSETINQAVFDADCTIELPAGRHTVGLANMGNDWVTLDSVTLRGTKSSRYAELRVTGLYDGNGGEVIAWLQDPASNYRNDEADVESRTIPASILSMPTGRGGDVAYDVEWWDTRTGAITRHAAARSTDGVLKIEVPPVRRDVAFRAVPMAPR